MVDLLNTTPHDSEFPAAVGVSLLTERAHTGNGYASSHKFGQVSGGGTASVLIQTPPNGDVPHLTGYSFSPDVSGEEVRIYEGTAVSGTGGAPDAVQSLSRRPETSPSTTVTVNPSVDTAGELMELEGVPNGGGGPSGNASVEKDAIDWTLDSGTNYLLEFTNTTSNQASVVYFNADWYEVREEELKT